MNSTYLLKKEKLKNFLKAVTKDYCLVAPQPASNSGDFLFQEVEDLEKIDLNYDVTSNTIKEFFFPQRERILNYERKGKSLKIEPVLNKIRQGIVFFGIRACDARAINFQDRFFAQEPKDNLYWQKRDKGILISFACNKPPRKSCFCAYTKSGPFLERGEGFDLQFIDLGKEYLAEIGTQQGKNFIKKYRKFFSPAGKESRNKKSSLKKRCLGEFGRRYNLLNVYAKLKSANPKGLWEELGRRCTNCGGCEFICPSCFCFYTQDIEYPDQKGERIRGWDSCTFCGYSRMSGGVNPHEQNADRISRRFFCKLYNCYNWFGVFSCTGCGRCSFVCPVNLDMESFIASLITADSYQPLLKAL